MGIVNPQMLKVYSQIEPELLCHVEDVILCRRADAAERLAEYAHGVQQTAQAQPQAPDAWRAGTLGERIAHAMLKGVADYVEQDALEGYEALGSPMAVIDTLLMPAMEQVGASGIIGKHSGGLHLGCHSRRFLRSFKFQYAASGEDRPRDETRGGGADALYRTGVGRECA